MEQSTVIDKPRVLTLQDRCDRCSAQAFVRVEGTGGELLFCGHHYNKAIDNAVGYDNLMKFAVTIIDERDRIE